MNLATRSYIEDVLCNFETGVINREQALWDLLEIHQIPDFEGIWELLMTHMAKTQSLLSQRPAQRFRPGPAALVTK